jgi:hypothetical protein
MLDSNTKALFLPGVADMLKKPMDVRQQWVQRVEASRRTAESGELGYWTKQTLMAQWLG